MIFHPIAGIFVEQIEGLIKEKDSTIFMKKLMLEKPNLKFVATNFLNRVNFIFIGQKETEDISNH